MKDLSGREDLAFFQAVIKLRQGKNLSCREEAAFYKKAYALQCEREAGAVRILQAGKGEGDYDEQLRKAARHMGWTTGTRRKKYNDAAIFQEYLDLIMGAYDTDTFKKIEAFSKEEALVIIKIRHGFPNIEACSKFLSRSINKRRKAGAHIPPILPR